MQSSTHSRDEAPAARAASERLATRQRVTQWSSELRKAALRKLRMLDVAEEQSDLRVPPGNRLERLTGDRQGQYSIRINDQWRIRFRWEAGNTETVRLIGRLSGRIDSVDGVLETVGLAHKATNAVSQLSGGKKRRLDFATAMYGRPELLFLDEPTTGLDIQSRDALWRVVEQLREHGSTIVLTTHYLEEAQQRADRIGLMHRGGTGVLVRCGRSGR